MKKCAALKFSYFTLFCFTMFWTLTAGATSLDQLYTKQIVEKIEPVQFNGSNFMAFHSIAGAVCASLGFTRLVEFESEPCNGSEQLLNFTSSESTAAYTNYANTCASHYKKLKSVTCAK